MLLDKSAIFAAIDAKTEDVEVPEWGGSVRVKAMTGEERDEWLAMVKDKDGKPIEQKSMAKLVMMSVVDGNNQRIFGHGDLDMLNKKSAAILDRIGKVALKLAQLDEQDIEIASKN